MSEETRPPPATSTPVIEYDIHSPPSQSVNRLSQQECDISSNNNGEVVGGDYCFPTGSTQNEVQNCSTNHLNHTMFSDKEVEKIEIPIPPESISSLLEGHHDQSSPTGATFQCRYRQCDFRTTNSSKFIEHENTHAQERSFQCDVCHMKFTLFANMRRHKMSHLGVRPFECCLCPKRFFRKDHLMEHVVRQHSKQRPYCCPFCVKSFNYRPHLKAHLSSDHSGVPLDKTCKICGFQASSITGAKVHYTTCHLKRAHGKQSTTSHSTSNGVTTSQSCGREEVTTAVDLGTVSQNFSFVPPSYPSLSLPLNNDVIIEGPTSAFSKACISQAVSTTSTFSGMSNGGNSIRKCSSPITVSPVGSVSSPTTTVSPSSSRLNHSTPRNLDVNVKPEPIEVVTDGSPDGNSSQARGQLDLAANPVETSLTSGDIPRQDTQMIDNGNSIHSSSLFHPARNSSYQESANWIQQDCPPVSTESQFTLSQDITLNSLPASSAGHSNLAIWSPLPVSRETKLSKSLNGRTGLKHSALISHPSTVRNHRKVSSYHCGDVKIMKDRRLLDGIRYSENQDSENTRRRESQLLEDNERISPTSAGYRHSLELTHHSKLHTESSMTESEQGIDMSDRTDLVCPFCGIIFPDRTLYFLHRSLHTDSSPWKCNLCGQQCRDRYDFNAHIISQAHH
ncbi:zinc finger protein Helios-like [Centruroides sculpturatus]|uniref:zinc finger protein Helios-like n=1 Tax=Centruroides sculpturatus TaxID=218467 RepID=UPI000C6E044E|nr:zinc finger protein Helios-like [Centruroides sculpturatus]XP_023223292.1 zinc finger protein Helios-like [Centruroides sculpturatus]XP_023223293.1 zinc finger protein Helios-like [Centruroides sculpturatus]